LGNGRPSTGAGGRGVKAETGLTRDLQGGLKDGKGQDQTAREIVVAAKLKQKK